MGAARCGEASEAAVASNDSVTGYDDSERVGRDGRPYGAGRSRLPHTSGKFAVTDRSAEGDAPKLSEDVLSEVGSACGTETKREAGGPASQVSRDEPDVVSKSTGWSFDQVREVFSKRFMRSAFELLQRNDGPDKGSVEFDHCNGDPAAAKCARDGPGSAHCPRILLISSISSCTTYLLISLTARRVMIDSCQSVN